MPETTPIQSAFNSVDVGLLVIIGVSGLVGLLRGFTRETLGIIAWVGASFATLWGLPFLKPHMREWIGHQMVADAVSGLVLFIAVLVTLMTLTRAVSQSVRGSILGGLDRSLGMLFGVFRGLAIGILVFIIANALWKPHKRPELLQSSRALPLLLKGTEIFAGLIPKGYIPPTYFMLNPEEVMDTDNLPLPKSPEELMRTLSQPKPKAIEKNKEADGYKETQRRDMDRLFNNFSKDADIQ